MTTTEETQKQCSKCDQFLSLSEFSKRAKSQDGLQHWCKGCNTSYRNEWITDNRDKVKINLLWSRHRLTPDDLKKMREDQGFVCKVCKESLGEDFVIEHRHGCCSGKNTCINCRRGLTCQSCNTLIGSVEKIRKLDLASALDNYLAAN